jgi:hypothetical protein
MKVLSTELQRELLDFLAIDFRLLGEAVDQKASDLANEIRPKRVRRKNIMGDGGTVIITSDGGTTFSENSVDNTVTV